MRPPLRIGTVVEPYGKIGAILFLSGERYYHLIDDDGCVSMMPAEMIEAMHDAEAVDERA